MTATILAATVGKLDPLAVARLREADKASASLLRSGQGVVISDNSTHHEIFDRLAERLAGRFVAANEKKLELFAEVDDPDAPARVILASDVAGDRWIPVVEAAYYLGLAVGLRLNGGGQ